MSSYFFSCLKSKKFFKFFLARALKMFKVGLWSNLNFIANFFLFAKPLNSRIIRVKA
jgi:hypothetical protein